jgi:hypothetical protein
MVAVEDQVESAQEVVVRNHYRDGEAGGRTGAWTRKAAWIEWGYGGVESCSGQEQGVWETKKMKQHKQNNIF